MDISTIANIVTVVTGTIAVVGAIFAVYRFFRDRNRGKPPKGGGRGTPYTMIVVVVVTAAAISVEAHQFNSLSLFLVELGVIAIGFAAQVRVNPMRIRDGVVRLAALLALFIAAGVLILTSGGTERAQIGYVQNPTPTYIAVLPDPTVAMAQPSPTSVAESTQPASSGGSQPVPETTWEMVHTWASPMNASGEGPTIAAFQKVDVSCRIQGYQTVDGDTWWYLVESSPWNNEYYAPADGFYNNGQTSGSPKGTPLLDQKVPLC